jgi:hypothetical protein
MCGIETCDPPTAGFDILIETIAGFHFGRRSAA